MPHWSLILTSKKDKPNNKGLCGVDTQAFLFITAIINPLRSEHPLATGVITIGIAWKNHYTNKLSGLGR